MFEIAGTAKDNGMMVPADHSGSASQSLSMSNNSRSRLLMLPRMLFVTLPLKEGLTTF
jgi:hypothetical protein